jgi:hypothetical protein
LTDAYRIYVLSMRSHRPSFLPDPPICGTIKPGYRCVEYHPDHCMPVFRSNRRLPQTNQKAKPKPFDCSQWVDSIQRIRRSNGFSTSKQIHRPKSRSDSWSSFTGSFRLVEMRSSLHDQEIFIVAYAETARLSWRPSCATALNSQGISLPLDSQY